jgi:O-antigen/teichoic acid export membrane protein
VVTGDPGATGREGGAITRQVARNTIVLVAGDAATKLGLFVLYALIARTLGDQGFGDYTLVVSLAFFVRAAGLGIDVILSREVARDLNSVHGLFWDSITFKLAAGTPVLIAVTAFAALGDYPGAVVAAVALIGLSNLIDILAYSAHAVLRGREDMAPGSKALVLESLSIVVLGSIVLIALDASLVALGAVYLLAALIALAYIVGAMRGRGIRPGRGGESRGLRWLGRAAVATGIASLFAYALGRVDAVLLSVITDDAAAVGLYGAAYRIFEATLFVSWAFGLAVLPMLSRLPKRSDELNRAFATASMAIAALTVPLGAAMALFGPEITEAVFGGEFADAGTATAILGGAAALYGLFTVAALTVAGQDRQGALPWISGVALAANVGLNLALIPSLGVDGAALAMSASQLLITIAAMAIAIRETGMISVGRAFSAVAGGAAAMGAVVALLGSGLAVLPLALGAYAIGFVAIEWLLHREDLQVFAQALRARGEQVADDPAYPGAGGAIG